MKSKRIQSRFRLLKAILFIFGVLGYGYSVAAAKGWIATSIFAFVLALYLSEVYLRGAAK